VRESLQNRQLGANDVTSVLYSLGSDRCIIVPFYLPICTFVISCSHNRHIVVTPGQLQDCRPILSSHSQFTNSPQTQPPTAPLAPLPPRNLLPRSHHSQRLLPPLSLQPALLLQPLQDSLLPLLHCKRPIRSTQIRVGIQFLARRRLHDCPSRGIGKMGQRGRRA